MSLCHVEAANLLDFAHDRARTKLTDVTPYSARRLDGMRNADLQRDGIMRRERDVGLSVDKPKSCTSRGLDPDMTESKLAKAKQTPKWHLGFLHLTMITRCARLVDSFH